MDNLEDVTFLSKYINNLKGQLEYVSDELEAARKEAIERNEISKENINNLVHILGIAYKERDEARDQVHKLMMYIKTNNSTAMIDRSNASSLLIDSFLLSPPDLSNVNDTTCVDENMNSCDVAEPLAKWRKPPMQVAEPPQVPPMRIKGCKSQVKPMAMKEGLGKKGFFSLATNSQMFFGSSSYIRSFSFV